MIRGLPFACTAVVTAFVLTSTLDRPAMAQESSASVPERRVPGDLLAELHDGPGGLTASAVGRLAAASTRPSVRRAELGAERAEEAMAEARAGLLPRIDLSASYTRLSEVDQPPLVFGGMEIANPFPQILDNYLLRASIALPVSDLLLRSLPAYSSAQGFAEASRHQVDAERRTLAFRAQESLFRYVQARGALAVARDSVALLEAHLARVEVLVGGGVLASIDRSQIAAQLESARVAALRAEGGVDVAGAALRRALGMEDAAAIEIGEDLGTIPEPTLPTRSQLLQNALAERPEARALRALVEANEDIAQAHRAGMFPSLSASATVDYANPNSRTIPQEEVFNATWQAGVVLRWSPNDALSSSHRAVQASLDGEQAQQDLLALEEGIRVEAADALVSARVARQAIVAAERGVTAAQESYEVQSALHEAGRTTSNDVLDAETALRRAQLELVQAHVDYRVALARVDYVAGRTAVAGGQ